MCVSVLLYTLIRLLKYHLKQKRINALTNEIINQSSSTTTTTILLKIHNLDEQDMISMKGEVGVFEPLIVQTQDVLPIYMENHQYQSPPAYKEHL